MGIGSIFTIGLKKHARAELKRAGATERISVLVRNLQRRRSFIRAARQAQAEALIGGVASGAGLESSGVQGTLASLITQEQFGVFEVREQQRRGLKVAAQRAEAQETVERAQDFESAIDTFASIAGSG
jgi:hypothetical protein